MKILKRSFFNRSTLIVAQELLGKVLVFQNHQGIITETEAYFGFEDPASHAFRGETPRSKIMFGEPYFSYVYLIYGMYSCFNIVTEKEGYPAAVLIRGIKLLNKDGVHLDGPGKLCRHLNLTKAHSAINMSISDELYVGCIKHTPAFTITPRIGIKVGTDKPWRFVATDV